MECGIIRDLMPSYIDGLTNEESIRAVEEHVQECAECRDFLDAMKAELRSEMHIQTDKNQEMTEIKAFKKLKKVMDRVIIGSVAAALLIVIMLWGFYEDAFIYRKSALSADVRVTYDNTDGVARIGFVPKKDNVCLEGWMGTVYDEASGKVLTNPSGREKDGLTLLKHGISPLRKEYNRDFYLTYIFFEDGTIICPNENGENIRVDENDILAVEFGDRTVDIPIKELRTKAGVEKLKLR